MTYPTFYSQIPSLLLHDKLSAFLGAIDNGEVEISYLDCVKLAGHSCPTVAGAYLMATKGLEALYGSDLPSRGEIKVEMHSDEAEGVTGVICNVIAFIVGANGSSGFKGIHGKFSRDNLVAYNIPMDGEVKLTRIDTNQSVTLRYDPSSVKPDPIMQPLMAKALQGTASKEEQEKFTTLWQERVETILLTPSLHTQIIHMTKD